MRFTEQVFRGRVCLTGFTRPGNGRISLAGGDLPASYPQAREFVNGWLAGWGGTPI